MPFQRKNIATMGGYVPGEQVDNDDVIKLNTNENPYPPSPEVAARLKGINSASLRRYPSPTAEPFRESAARCHGIAAENIVPTNGGDELLRLVLTTFAGPGETVAVTRPTYSLYRVLTEIQDNKLHEITLEDTWDLPKEFIQQLSVSNAKVCILVNPHAPTGKLLSVEALTEIASNFDGLLLVDEAYVDFVDLARKHDAVPMAIEHNNVLLLRTLSKGYSLAGLRFGYGIGSAELISPILYKTRDSYNTDYIAQQLADAAIQSRDYARAIWQKVREDRELLADALTKLNFAVTPSQANFLLAKLPDGRSAESLYLQLRSENILVRFFDQERLRDKLRISVGTPSENAALIAALTAKFVCTTE
ncbi:MAG: histidinol-phosphate transaminase [Gammaproteobacteria bacterium]|nr:histidinol-phosphate transaminase [Gammaproteobacteria bacterium]HBW82959.1 histidinol-phosphate transaminase [Gammaproteobacteria bacterium]|tara:strand:+ start:7840 stop:8925 length:1086 start_codon:yes stop_codon:yes gene_type:complete